MSDHFGHAKCFTIVDIDEGRVSGTEVMQNPPHASGGCMAPVNLLKGKGVSAIIVGGMGARPLMGFRQVGIQVVAGASGKVGDIVDAYLAGKLRPAGEEIICGHSKDGGCSH
jgi:predicted Fe-Mo cluster-binding NifX family protein